MNYEIPMFAGTQEKFDQLLTQGQEVINTRKDN
jgi:hypothetical protein